jgi:hypothetical protein
MTEDAMKTRWVVAAALLTAGRGMDQDHGPALTVYLHHGPNAAAGEICRAESIAARILAGAGVHVDWRSGTHRAPTQVETIEIQLDDSPPTKDASSEALGYALLQRTESVRIHIFLDRIHALDRRRTGLALGHVLAHEIGHVLEGVSRHSETGALKANFDAADMRAIFKAPLQFAPVDVALIQAHFLDRAHTD